MLCVCVFVCVRVMEEVDVTSFLWLRQTPGAAFEHENDSVCSQRASLFVVHEHSPRFLFVFFSLLDLKITTSFIVRAAGRDQTRLWEHLHL